MDATLVPAPRQRNNDVEKAEINAGKTAREIWPDKPARARQKDVGANWTLKLSKAKPRIDGAMLPTLALAVFRCKDHIPTDRRHGLIRKWAVTSASANDGARLPDLLHKANTASDLWADTAYRSKKNKALLEKQGFVSGIHRKKPKGRSMSKRTARANGGRSKVRVLFEDVLADQKHRMGLFI